MRFSLTAALLVCLAPAAHADWSRPSALETVPLVLAETSLALDALQTLDIKRHHDCPAVTTACEMAESNPILGQHPGDAKVIGYFVGVGLLTGAAWYALPRGWRVLVPLAVVALQVSQIERNARFGFTIRL